MTEDEVARRKIDQFLKEAKTLNVIPVAQRLGAGIAILQAAGLTALALLVADCKQLEDQLAAMHPGELTQDIEHLEQRDIEVRDKIIELANAHQELLDKLVALMPPENRETALQMFSDTVRKVSEIVLLGLRSSLVAREIFSDEAEFDKCTRSDIMQ